LVSSTATQVVAEAQERLKSPLDFVGVGSGDDGARA
jgi:hypothetical protein